MSATVTLTDQEETNLYRARKLLQLGADLACQDAQPAPLTRIEPEALAIYLQLVAELLPNKD